MQGVLFKYGPGASHIAFKHSSNSPHHSEAAAAGRQRYLVLVGGLTDGLLFAPYCQRLTEQIPSEWTLVQAQLTSSYQGWGLASLDQDASDVKLLSDCLSSDHDCCCWVLMGHSTGCQDAVRYVNKYRDADPRLAGVILQAPVSDREYFSLDSSWQPHITAAQDMVAQGKGEDIVCRALDWDGAAVTARRLVSLTCPGGDDDMFSTDLTLQQLRDILGPLQGLPTLILQSGADEAIPQTLRGNGSILELGQRMVEAINLEPGSASKGSSQEKAAGAAAVAGGRSDEGLVQLHVIEGAGHACRGHEQQVTDLVCQFLKQLTPEGQAA